MVQLLKKWPPLLGIPFIFFISSAVAAPEDEGSILDQPDYDSSTPWYQTVPSSWAWGLRAGLNEFPMVSSTGNLFLVNFEWMIPYQDLGVLSLGAEGGVVPLELAGSPIAPTNFMNPWFGGLLRYQLKVFKTQPIVPTASLSYDYYQIKTLIPTTPTVSGSQMGLSYGLMVNLTWIDPITARGAFQSIGLTRAYVTAEIFQADLKNSVFSLKSKFFMFGLRTEFR